MPLKLHAFCICDYLKASIHYIQYFNQFYKAEGGGSGGAWQLDITKRDYMSFHWWRNMKTLYPLSRNLLQSFLAPRSFREEKPAETRRPAWRPAGTCFFMASLLPYFGIATYLTMSLAGLWNYHSPRAMLARDQFSSYFWFLKYIHSIQAFPVAMRSSYNTWNTDQV